MLVFRYILNKWANRFLRLQGGVFSIVILGLAACSSDSVKREPVALEDIVEKASITRLWHQDVGSGMDGRYLFLRPVILGGVIFTIDVAGQITALNKKTGKVVGEWDMDETVIGGLGADSRSLYYASENGEFVALAIDWSAGAGGFADGGPLETTEFSADFLKQRFRVPLSSESLVAPQSDGDLVYVQTIDGKLAAYAASDGEEKWRYSADKPLLSIRGTAQPTLAQGMVATGFSNGELVVLDSENGQQVWHTAVGLARGRTELERLVDVDGAPFVQDRFVYAVAFQGQVKVLDLATGREYWAKPASSHKAVGSGYQALFISDSDGVVASFDKTSSTENWKQEGLKYRKLTAPAILRTLVVVADFEGYVHFLAQSDGQFQARVRADSNGVQAPLLVDDDILYVYGNSGQLTAYTIREK
ncbi:MAG: hypothetical protein CSA50_00950 [Gammaproteobacteria bacterium]|nr:MAG: hypothetical protein CSA50_00950 [Gammaproteobacteria bacterium]